MSKDARFAIVLRAVRTVTRWSPAARRYEEDLIQEAWLRLISQRSQLHPAFQFKIARSAAWKTWRRLSAPVTLAGSTHQPIAETEDKAPVRAEPQQPELRVTMLRALSKLPRRRAATLADFKRVWRPFKETP
jgi:DNA-directed RNA polymerase specialized sigma24 family protein